MTCARGSSAHAATFGKHLIERHLGIPVAAAAPNIATLYRRRLELKGQLLLTISQSGRSDDLIEFTAMAKSAGALTAAIVNDTESPLAAVCDVPLPMAAGPELSVAATKIVHRVRSPSCCASRRPGPTTRISAERSSVCPTRLAAANRARLERSAWRSLRAPASLITIGRGPTLAIAREAALKLKELCDLHAEAFSGAEFQHGPMALVSTRYPIVLFMPDRRGRERPAGACGRSAAQGRGAVRDRRWRPDSRPAAGARSRSPGCRCGLPDAELLRARGPHCQAARHRCRAAAPSAEGDPHPMNAPTQHAVAADCVFDGTVVQRNAAVVIEGPRIAAVVPRTELSATIPIRDMPDGAWLAPGFIDVQVNGGGDVLFNDTPTADGIRAIAAAHRKFGTTALLPTLISDTPEKMRRPRWQQSRNWPKPSPVSSASISKGRFSRPNDQACTRYAIFACRRRRTSPC